MYDVSGHPGRLLMRRRAAVKSAECKTLMLVSCDGQNVLVVATVGQGGEEQEEEEIFSHRDAFEATKDGFLHVEVRLQVGELLPSFFGHCPNLLLAEAKHGVDNS
jgi:hypothetical protein